MTWPASSPGWLLEPRGDARPRGMVVHDRTRLIGRLHWLLRNFLFRCARQERSGMGFAIPSKSRSGHPWPHFSSEARFDGAFWRAMKKPVLSSILPISDRGLQGGSRPEAGAAECAGKMAVPPLRGLNRRARLSGSMAFHQKHASMGRSFASEKPVLAGILRCGSCRAGSRPKAGAAECVAQQSGSTAARLEPPCVLRGSDRGVSRLSSDRSRQWRSAMVGNEDRAFTRSFKVLPITPPKCLKFRRGRRHKRSRFARDLPRFFLDSPVLATYCGLRWFFVVDRGSCSRVRRR